MEVAEKTQQKWTNELGSPRQLNWTDIYARIYDSTDDRSLRWLQYQCVHRILPTNRLLHLYKLVDSDKCRFCPMYRENVTHLFWHCPESRAFWRSCSQILGLPVLKRDCVLFGTNAGGSLHIQLNAVILLAKQCIWACRLRDVAVSMQCFLKRLDAYLAVEKYVYCIRDKRELFNERWSQIQRKVKAALSQL